MREELRSVQGRIEVVERVDPGADLPPCVTGMLGGGTALGWRGQKRPQPNYIWVSEPWPLGVVMLSQVPLATYFQACGS